MTPEHAHALAEERRIMNFYAPDYDAWRGSNSYVYELEREHFAAWVLRTLRDDGRDIETLRILDAGTGPGNLVELLAPARPATLVGVDVAEEMLRVARRKRLPRSAFVQTEIERLALAEESFDVVVAAWTVHHLARPESFFEMVDRVLRRGGWFFVLDYDAGFRGAESDAPADRRRSWGDRARRVVAWKNRRALARRPDLPRLFNPAHRLLGASELRAAVVKPAEYETRWQSHGILVPAFLPVLMRESRTDRWLARGLGRVDSWLAPRVGGLFQWFAGRRPGPDDV